MSRHVLPVDTLAHLQTHDSMQSALQDHPAGGRDFVIRRAHRLPVDADAVLAREPPRLALAADQTGVEEELRDGALTGLHLAGLRSGGHKSAGLASILAGRRVRMELTDEPLRQPLLDVARILALANPRLFGGPLV